VLERGPAQRGGSGPDAEGGGRPGQPGAAGDRARPQTGATPESKSPGWVCHTAEAPCSVIQEGHGVKGMVAIVNERLVAAGRH
jgi:hypothetical protein